MKERTPRRPAAPRKPARRPAPAERLIALQRSVGNRAVGRLIARQDQPDGGAPVSTPEAPPEATPFGPPVLTDVQERFLAGLDINASTLPPEMLPRLGRGLERARRAHDALRGDMSVDLGGGNADASSEITDTSASLSVTVIDDEVSITIKRHFDFASGRLVQSFTYEDVDGRVLHATVETEGPNALLAQVPIALESAEGSGALGPPPPPLGEEEIDTFEDAIAPETSGTEEGVGSFVAGAIAGDFAENDSFSAIAGQTVVGLIPIAGQIADVRDMAAAIRGVAQGRDGAMLNVGIAAIGFIPGLDFLKGGSRVGRRALREAAEESVQGVTKAGLKRARRLLSRTAAREASKRLSELMVGRKAMIGRLEKLGRETRDPAIAARARRTVNALNDHYNPSDLSGALRDRLGIPVRESGSGEAFDHLQEVDTAIRSMRNTRERILQVMEGMPRNSPEFGKLSDTADALKEMLKKTDEYLNLQ